MLILNVAMYSHIDSRIFFNGYLMYFDGWRCNKLCLEKGGEWPQKGEKRVQELTEEGTLDSFTFKCIPNEDCSPAPGHIQFLYKMCQCPNLLMYLCNPNSIFFLSLIFQVRRLPEKRKWFSVCWNISFKAKKLTR